MRQMKKSHSNNIKHILILYVNSTLTSRYLIWIDKKTCCKTLFYILSKLTISNKTVLKTSASSCFLLIWHNTQKPLYFLEMTLTRIKNNNLQITSYALFQEANGLALRTAILGLKTNSWDILPPLLSGPKPDFPLRTPVFCPAAGIQFVPDPCLVSLQSSLLGDFFLLFTVYVWDQHLFISFLHLVS